MDHPSIQLWADSLGKGVVYDESRNRYIIIKESCGSLIEASLGMPLENHSRMGATAEDGYSRFLESPAVPGAISVIAYGGNDCDMPWAAISEDPTGEYDGKTPLGRFMDILGDFVTRSRQRGMAPLLVTPPPLMAKRYFEWVSRGLNPEAILKFLGDVAHIYRWQERYSIAVRKVAESTKCALFDMRDAFLADMDYPHLLCLDGIHPNTQGHALIARAVLAARVGIAAKL